MLRKLKVKFMGYLRQRKKEKRTDMTLKLLLMGISLLLIGSFYGEGEGLSYYLSAYRFHYYLISVVVLFYCLFKQFFSYAFFFLILVIFCFMSFGYSSRILFNDAKNNKDELSILYISSVPASKYEYVLDKSKNINADFTAINGDNKEDSSNIIFSRKDVSREGIIRLSNKYNAYFVVTEIEEKELIFVDVDFSKIKEKELKVVFNNLTEFVKLQESPVVMFGDFGVAAWSKTFVKFLNTTGLEVKNRIILTNGRFRFNPFNVPTINVLGYKNMGLEKIMFLPKNKNKKHPILFKISF